MKEICCLFVFACLMYAAKTDAQISVTYHINTAQERDTISKYIYGANNTNYPLATFIRFGGNRTSAYNWENNFSNAGADYYNENDNYLPWVMGIHPADYLKTGICLQAFNDSVLAHNGIAALTLPMVGYVANDGNGIVQQNEIAPSPRWGKIINQKGSAFTLHPDTTDSKIYVDEEINFLLKKFGTAKTATGVKAYVMDNEPGLWVYQFSHMRTYATTYNELFTKSISLAATIKKMDADALVLGSEAWGFSEYWNLQNAPDAGNYSTDHWFIDTYLKTMKHAQDSTGKRLLDVFSIHWYPQVNGVYSDDTSAAVRSGRIQCPRTLWDSGYKENSWIINSGFGAEFPLIQHIQKSINTFYPKTKFGITEYDYGAHNDISGGIAQADVLGIFGKYGLDYAASWGNIDGYVKTAFDLYLNYDGNRSVYGLINVKATDNNVTSTSIYSSVNDNSNDELHTIIINKNSSKEINATVQIQGNVLYDKVRAYYFDASGKNIKHKSFAAGSINNNVFTCTIPAYSVYHFVFTKNAAVAGNSITEKSISSIKIYPNPAGNKINIEIPAAGNENTLCILNAAGDDLIRQKIIGQNTDINITSLKPGIYFAKLLSGLDAVDIKKFIKQ